MYRSDTRRSRRGGALSPKGLTASPLSQDFGMFASGTGSRPWFGTLEGRRVSSFPIPGFLHPGPKESRHGVLPSKDTPFEQNPGPHFDGGGPLGHINERGEPDARQG